ncbi:MAG: hypothetical protein ABA06_00530 [Parcubacteria bacterium C7867-001]|nr:MAG: hypothetical protein ABA06_00530 [Parcubacteria bacterium C7867-001]
MIRIHFLSDIYDQEGKARLCRKVSEYLDAQYHGRFVSREEFCSVVESSQIGPGDPSTDNQHKIRVIVKSYLPDELYADIADIIYEFYGGKYSVRVAQAGRTGPEYERRALANIPRSNRKR